MTYSWDEKVTRWEAEDRALAEQQRARACGALAAMLLLAGIIGLGTAVAAVVAFLRARR